MNKTDVEIKAKRQTEVIGATPDSRPLSFLYRNPIGRVFIRLVTSRLISKIGGWYLSTKWSCRHIGKFVSQNQIDLSQYEAVPYRCYNDFFVRQLLPGKRPVTMVSHALISPCDARLTVYPIQSEAVFQIKDRTYTIAELLQDKTAAEAYGGGDCLIFRLCVDDYHRYCYVDDGVFLEHKTIPGRLHTVRPIALERDNYFVENEREISVFQTAHFGKLTQIEIGAMMIGKICNHATDGEVMRGEEKGYFAFGGSTIVVLLEPGAAEIEEEILQNTAEQKETLVKYGEQIGNASIL